MAERRAARSRGTFGPVVLLGLAGRRARRGRRHQALGGRRRGPAHRVPGRGLSSARARGRRPARCRWHGARPRRAGLLGRRARHPRPGPPGGRRPSARSPRSGLLVSVVVGWSAVQDSMPRQPRRSVGRRPRVGLATPRWFWAAAVGAVLCVRRRRCSPCACRPAGPRWAAGTTPPARRSRRRSSSPRSSRASTCGRPWTRAATPPPDRAE